MLGSEYDRIVLTLSRGVQDSSSGASDRGVSCVCCDHCNRTSDMCESDRIQHRSVYRFEVGLYLQDQTNDRGSRSRLRILKL